jgi:hypothetical protein
VADRQLLARKRDVDDFLAQAAVELTRLDSRCGRVDPALDPLADAVEEHSGVAVPDLTKCPSKRTLSAHVLHTQTLDVIERPRLLESSLETVFVRLPIHGGDCSFVVGQKSSSFVAAGPSGPGSEREVRRQAPGFRFQTGAR